MAPPSWPTSTHPLEIEPSPSCLVSALFELCFSQHQHAAPRGLGFCVCVCEWERDSARESEKGRERERERLQGSSPVSWSILYVCHLLSTTPAWPTSAWPTRLHSSSVLFPLVPLCLICSLFRSFFLSPSLSSLPRVGSGSQVSPWHSEQND